MKIAADAGHPPTGAPTIAPAGDRGLYVRFTAEEGLSRVPAALAALDEARVPGIVDLVPAFASILVVYDPVLLDEEDARSFVARALAAPARPGAAAPRRIEIPVLYDPDDADVSPDLAALASERGVSIEAVIEAHAAPEYRCAMLGFRPGFPYLAGLPPWLHAARLPMPRPRVPAGAVGIGGPQTGIYPSAGPGGWRLVGRTPLRLFDPARADPFLLHPGDVVKLVPVNRAAYEGAS